MGKTKKPRGRGLVYILWGQDDFSLRESLADIKKSLGDPGLLESNTTMLDGRSLMVDELSMVCNAAPFLSEKRLVVVSRLLGRFGPPGKSGRRKKSSKAKDDEGYRPFADCISKIAGSTVLVLVDDELSRGNPLLSELVKSAEVRSFPVLRSRELEGWVRQRVKGEGGRISADATSLLARLVGSNLWIMASEIDKLVLYTSGRQIEVDDINKMVSYAQQTSIYAMTDAILASKARLAGTVLQRLLYEGASPVYLLVVLSRQVQQVFRARVLESQGVPVAQIQHKLGITHDFILRKTLEQAQRHTLARLKEVYHRLLEADLSIKTGRFDGELALTLLVAELCR